MWRVLILLCVLALQGCMLGETWPDPATTRPEMPAAAPDPPPPPVVATPPEAPLVYVPDAPPPAPPPPSQPAPPKRVRASESPEAIIREAHQKARIEPTRRGYFGNSAVQRYEWQPGRIYKVYVNPQQMTKIILPPGELLVSKVYLDPEAWDVQSYRVGVRDDDAGCGVCAAPGRQRGARY